MKGRIGPIALGAGVVIVGLVLLWMLPDPGPLASTSPEARPPAHERPQLASAPRKRPRRPPQTQPETASILTALESRPDLIEDDEPDGAIKGTVTFANAPSPLPGPIDMGSKDAICNSQPPKIDEYYVVGENGAAANVLVYVKSGPALQLESPVPVWEVTLDQVNCMFTPRVIGVRAGQPLRFHNSDPTEHVVHMASAKSGDWTQILGPHESLLVGPERSQHRLNAEYPPVKITCDIHGWMRAYCGVFDHDWFQVTTKAGRYEFVGLPPGEYEIGAWHERATAEVQRVTIRPKEAFELKLVLRFP